MSEHRALVEKVVEGRHGPYAVARVERLGVVTFSLDQGVWPEKSRPEPGTEVMLTEVIKKRAGWRALHSRFVTPADEEEKNNKKQQQ